MRIIVHSLLNAFRISQSGFSFLIKVGYVLSDETISMGYANLYVNLINGLKEGPMEYKLKMMEKDLDKVIFATEIEQINEYFINKKVYDKIKHKTPDQIRWNIINDKNYLDFYRKWEEVKANEMVKIGYNFLHKLVEEKTLRIGEVIEDGYKFEDVKSVSLESLFNLNLPDTDCKKNLMIFQDIFLSIVYLKPEDKFVSALDDAATDTKNSWFQYVASITNVNRLTETELRALRTSFFQKMHNFRNEIEQWVEVCNTTNNSVESLNYFKENLLPLLPLVESYFEKEDILKYYHDNTKPNHFFYMYIGEITKSALLNYYELLMPITSELKQTLEAKFIADGTFNRRIPMIVISNSKILSLPLDLSIDEYKSLDPEEEPTDLQKRKYIQIND